MIKKSIVKAYDFAKKAHQGQKRKFSDLDYFVHPKAVARRIEELGGTEEMIVASFLHDVIEDTNITFETIEIEFGTEVYLLVCELTSDKEVIRDIGKQDYLAGTMAMMSSNALAIKLADREHNIKFLIEDSYFNTHESVLFLKKYYKETLYIILSLKNAIQMNWTKEFFHIHEVLIDSIDYYLKKISKIIN